MQHCVHHRAIWRKLADWVGVHRVSGQQRGLTTATAEIDFSLRTTLARLRHPFRSAKPVETFRFPPDPIKRARPDIFECEIGNCGRSSRAREHITDWIDCEIALSPAVETRFGPGFVIVREHIKDIDLTGEPRLCCAGDFSRAND